MENENKQQDACVTQAPSIGEYRVRTNFNVSNDSLVNEIKNKTAELINLCHQFGSAHPELMRLKSLAMTSYEEAAMWALKAVTFK